MRGPCEAVRGGWRSLGGKRDRRLDSRPAGHIPGWPISLGEGWSRHKSFRRDLWAHQSLSLPKTTATIAKFVPEVDIMAIGGLVNPEHVVEMLMLGAKTVGLSSGFFWKGRALLRNSVAFLSRFLDEHGYESVQT